MRFFVVVLFDCFLLLWICSAYFHRGDKYGIFYVSTIWVEFSAIVLTKK